MLITTKAGYTHHGFKFPAGAEVRHVAGNERGWKWVQVKCPDVPLGPDRGPSWESIPAHAVEFAEVAVYVPAAVQSEEKLTPYVSYEKAVEIGATDIRMPDDQNPLLAGTDRVATWPAKYWPKPA